MSLIMYSHVLEEKQGLKRVRLNFSEEYRKEREYGWTFLEKYGRELEYGHTIS